MKNLFLFATLVLCSSVLFAQLPVVNLPVIPVPSQHIYISPAGNDANPGTSALPKKTFYAAMTAINFGTPSVPDNYGEIVLLPGDYYPGPN